MRNTILLLTIILFCAGNAIGQAIIPDIDIIAPNRIEKTYIHTDRPFYFPGETIWFKTYVTNVKQEASSLSEVAYVELLSPEGSILKTNDYRIVNGYIYGQITIDKNWIGGIYKLRAYTNWMKNNGEEALFTKKITVQKIIEPRLQMKFDFNKEAYGPGSIVNATLELKDLKNNVLKNKMCTYTISINGKKEIVKKQKSSLKGILEIQFTLPNNLKTTDAIVNVTIDHLGNTEAISRSVPVILDTIDLQLLPESGVLLNNFENTVAFKALNAYGKPADVNGYIKNSDGEVVANFSSYHNGMGSFNFVPQVDSQYTAHITAPFISKVIYKLPKVEKEGINLHVNKVTSTTAFITINSSLNKTIEICASDAQETIYSNSVKINKNSKTINIPLADFPKGIVKITIQTKDGKHIAERLLFAHYHQNLLLDIKTDKEIYATREKVDVVITTKDHLGKPVPANLSLAVVDNKLLSFADDRQDTIVSYFLMSSELQGTIYKPNFYFNSQEEKAHIALDYVLLTHGWRTYIQEPAVDILNAEFQPEKLSLQSGTVVDLNGNPTKAKLMLFDLNSDSVLPFETNDSGKFVFKMAQSTKKTLIAYNDKGDKLEFEMDDANTAANQKTYLERQKVKESTIERERSNQIKVGRPNTKIIKQKAKAIKNTSNGNANISLESDNALDEVIVTAQGIRREKKALGYAVSTVKAEEITTTGDDVGQLLMGRAAGVQITSSSGSPGSGSNIIIRGNSAINGSNQPLFIIDGIPFNSSSGSDGSNYVNIDPNNIKSINVLKGLSATMLYGSSGKNGVILITSKNGYFTKGAKKLSKRKFKNYAVTNLYSYNSRNFTKSADFYVPKYDITDLAEERTDFRPTIYWNPVVQTDKNGIATLSYYNSDATTSFNIIVEGVDPKGQVAHKEHSYSVQKALSIDFKIPPYMSVGDEVILPITIKNDTNEAITGNLDIILPDEFAFANVFTQQTISVPKNNFTVIPVAIIPKKQIAETRIRTHFKADIETDFIEKSTSIVSPYFPTESSISGVKNGTFELPIENLVDGTLTANFNIYTDVVGDVMDGIASLIRQPYGCFEQTSSSTYPNVMILKYLRESGKSNPEIEQKALDFIKQGYDRLISFETSQGGFEWFGRTPPHETLTAFGILEFTEMKEVYPEVSQDMIDRTVKWLLNRRDGEGGFHKSKKGYDSFASSPQDVANAYIVYALSAAKVKADINKEYIAAYNDALQSKDSYKIAMMACAASELGHNQDFKTLLDVLKSAISEYGYMTLPVKNTITRSYGNDKQTETLAFTILALLEEENKDHILISKAIKALTSTRKKGRFGATQATAMSLKALISYTSIQKQRLINSEDNIVISVNNTNLSKKMETSSNGKIEIKNIASYLKSGNNTIAVQFSNKKNTFSYSLDLSWSSTLPTSTPNCPLELQTTLQTSEVMTGDTVRLTTTISNKKQNGLGMVNAIIGIPSGTSAQPWQLKELIETNQIAYYEIFDNYVVFYWRSFDANQSKVIHLDLKAEVRGIYTAAASSAYLYYGEEFKVWKKGVTAIVK